MIWQFDHLAIWKFPLSHRPDQLAAALEHAVREVLSRGLHDPRVSGLITVTSVKVSPDLRHATVGISVMPSEKAALTMQGIQSASTYIRREVGERVRTRVVPQFIFKLDVAAAKEAGVIHALRKAQDHDAAQQTPGQVPGWSAPSAAPDTRP